MEHDIDKLQLPKDTSSFIYNIQNRMIASFSKNINDFLKAHLKTRLKLLGFEFKNDFEFNEFCLKRITGIYSGKSEEVHKLYLDYKDENNKGTPLLGYSTEISMNVDDYSINETITNIKT